MSNVTPVTHPDVSDARYVAAAAMSLGSPMRPSGKDWASASNCAAGIAAIFWLRTADGASALTRTPYGAYSAARWRVSITTPALATAYATFAADGARPAADDIVTI